MTVYDVNYKAKNPQTGRTITRVKWRAQVRRNGKTYSKLCDTQAEAIQEERRLIKIAEEANDDGLTEALEAQSETERINLSWLLWHHYETSKEKLGELNRKAVENRCVKAIPRVKINANLLPAKHRLYAFNKELTFGDVKVRDCDAFVIVTYILARRDAGIKDNTILRELSLISCAFEAGFMPLRDEFPEGLPNPVKLVPSKLKPKPYLGRKRTVSDEEAAKIAEWLRMKDNQEPYFLFCLCLETGMRKSECLGIRHELIDTKTFSVFLPNTKNGRPRPVPLPEHFTEFKEFLASSGKTSGPVFKLTSWNFRQYWVDALKALNLYEINDRLHFHDTRRTFITKFIMTKDAHTLTMAKQLGVSPQTVEQVRKGTDAMLLIEKFRSGQLTEQEFLGIVGHANMSIHNAYNGDRN